MRRRWLSGTLLAMVAALAITLPATAGGWATVEIDKPITRVEVGEDVSIQFTLLQHGVTPTDWTTTYFEATNIDTGDTLRVEAQPGGETGHWTVDVSFPSSGNWDWAIKTDELAIDGTFPTLSVVDSAAATRLSSEVTPAQMEAAITQATDPLMKQLSSISGEMDILRKQVTTLADERDTLQQQIANLESSQANQTETSTTSVWLAALIGALSAIIVGATGMFLALRRGRSHSPEFVTAST